MKTNLTVDIGLEVASERERERLEEALSDWVKQQPGVTGMRVLHQGDLNSAAWRQSRAQVFGAPLRSPFGRAGEPH